MNQKERKIRIKENWYKYHIRGMSNIHRVKRNAIFINRNNSKEHEKVKVDLAYECQTYLTEAERSATEEEIKLFKLRSAKKIVDFVDLITGIETEIIHKHESDLQINYYRKHGIIPVIVGDKFMCDKCKMIYPRRNKGNLCQICKRGVKWIIKAKRNLTATDCQNKSTKGRI